MRQLAGTMRFHSQYLANHVSMHVRQTTLNSVLIVRQLLMVDAKQVQRRGVQIVAVAWILSGLEAYRIACSVISSALDSASGQP